MAMKNILTTILMQVKSKFTDGKQYVQTLHLVNMYLVFLIFIMKHIIEAEGLSKCYRLGNFGSGTLSVDLQQWMRKRAGRVQNTEQREGWNWSLRDVSFSVKEGDIFGIVGKNGAGKSTLLKILSKITKPTKGIVRIGGSIASLLEVGTGFHPDLTGRENVFLNGSIIGMKRNEIVSKLEAIIEFSGIGKYIDTPVKRYSSGMYVRLGFAIAAHLEPEILVVDEVLAVGDYEFQQKCIGKMKDVANNGRTILFVSHSLPAIKQLCRTGIYLEKGFLKAAGPVQEVLSIYQGEKLDAEDGSRSDQPGNLPAIFTRWYLEGEQLPGLHCCYSGDTVTFCLELEVRDILHQCEMRMMIKYESLIILHASSLSGSSGLMHLEPGKYTVRFTVNFPIRDASFELEACLFSQGEMIDLWLSGTRFVVLDNYSSRVNPGVLNTVPEFRLEKSHNNGGFLGVSINEGE